MIFTPPPPPVTNCHTFSDPLWSVTYFMDGPLYARPVGNISNSSINNGLGFRFYVTSGSVIVSEVASLCSMSWAKKICE